MAPYDCDSISEDDDMAGLVLLSCIADGPQWWQLGRQLLWSLVVWCLVYLASRGAEGFWDHCTAKKLGPARLHEFLAMHVGTEVRPARSHALETLLQTGQLASSGLGIILWIRTTYALAAPTGWQLAAEYACAGVQVAHALFEHVRRGFDPGHCRSPLCLIDCLTISPVLLQGVRPALFGGSWLTLTYIRAYPQLLAFKYLCAMGALEGAVSDYGREALLRALECATVVFTIAGTTWVLEGLGDVPELADTFMASGMGPISFFQMVYFTLITISTVGYGDYSPSTVLSRAFVVLSIFAGVAYFSYATIKMVELHHFEASGMGRFEPSGKVRFRRDRRGRGRGHVIIAGGAVAANEAAVLTTFLQGLCRDENSEGLAEVVLLSETPISPFQRRLMQGAWARRFNLKVLVGSVHHRGDMARARASDAAMIFILGDFQTSDRAGEDRSNLLMASHVQRAYPGTDFRLLLNSMPGLALATQLGIDTLRSFSIEALQASMIATSLRCPGFSTLILNLGLPDLPCPDEAVMGLTPSLALGGGGGGGGGGSSSGKAPKFSPWLREYVAGTTLQAHGFQVSGKFVGKTFSEAALGLAKDPSTSSVLLLGAQVGGDLQLNPSSLVLTKDTVVFAVARDDASCGTAAFNGDASVQAWYEVFKEQRSEARCVTAMKRSNLAMGGALGTFSASPLPPPLSPSFIAAPAISILGGPKKGSVPEPAGAPPQWVSPPLGPPPPPLPSVTAPSAASSGAGAADDQSRTTHVLSHPQRPTLSKVAGAGGHTVVLLTDLDAKATTRDVESSWQQCGLIVRIFRDTWDDQAAVVIVHPPSETESKEKVNLQQVWRSSGANVHFVVGNCLDPGVLAVAGVPNCSRLLSIAPNAHPLGGTGAALDALAAATVTGPNLTSEAAVVKGKALEFKLDEANMVLVMLVEKFEADVWTSRTAPMVGIFDWYNPKSLRLLPPPTCKAPTPAAAAAARNAITAAAVAEAQAALAAKNPQSSQRSHSSSGARLGGASSSARNTSSSKQAAATVSPEELLAAHFGPPLRYFEKASGGELLEHRLFPAPAEPPAGATGAPGAAHALRSHMSSSTGSADAGEYDDVYQERHPRAAFRFAGGRVVPKPSVAAMFSMAFHSPGALELFEALIHPAKYNQRCMPWMLPVPPRLVGSSYRTLALELLAAGAVPMGLLRAAGSASGCPLPYVVACTAGCGHALAYGDAVYVVADRRWAERHGLTRSLDLDPAVADAGEHDWRRRPVVNQFGWMSSRAALELRRFFDRIDADCSGDLTKGELIRACHDPSDTRGRWAVHKRSSGRCISLSLMCTHTHTSTLYRTSHGPSIVTYAHNRASLPVHRSCLAGGCCSSTWVSARTDR